MNTADLLKDYPSRRIKPVDGMAVTSEVWEEAHDYHRGQLRYHNLLVHGLGIVTGLEVVASDPPDSAVYVSPGIGIDAAGREMMVAQPLSFDLGAAQGTLHLVLTHSEGQPRSEGGKDDGVMYIHEQFALEAAGSLANTTGIELARIKRSGRGTPIVNAKDAAHPAANEIDLRFRKDVGAATSAVATVAVSYVGGTKDQRHGRGADYLARSISRSDQQRVWIDDNAPLNADLLSYTLVYLVGHDAFQFSPDEMNAIYAYLQGGGTLLYESCRHDTSGDSPADAAFLDLLSSFGQQIDDLPINHSLLAEPNLFSAPPAGFDASGKIRIGGGVIVSTFDYGCLWQGEKRGGAASREEIRSAHEWGENIVAYAMTRRK